MKTSLKKITSTILLLSIVLFSSGAFAQRGSQGGGQQGPPPAPTSEEIEEMVSDLSSEISLNEDQEIEILDLYTAHFNEQSDKMKSGKPNRKEMESLKTEFEEEVKALLTEEQQELFDAYKKKNNRKGKSKRSH